MASEWYQVAYKGGGPVKVKGFPRPLYPPDASKHGKKASVDGPDIKALKRALCRGGRWGDWNPDAWDEAFSNAFSHGKGTGNVKDSGIAGFQRQMDIDDTGWWGKSSFTTLTYCLISDPNSPHVGQPLLDGPCVQLLNQAFDKFGGKEPAPSGGGTIRKAALDLAVTQIGVKESPANSNQCKYTSWYGMTGPWCAMFVTWCFLTNTTGKSPSFVKGSKYAYVPYVVADARSGKNRLMTTDDPQPGDLVCYDWGYDGTYDHIGIFEKWTSGTSFNAIEGNTSTSNNSNGGQVMRRTRNRSAQATTFVVVKEP